MSQEWVIRIVALMAIIGGIAWGVYTISAVGGKYACECDREFKRSRKEIFPF